jgi:two-component system LytT family response regulator
VRLRAVIVDDEPLARQRIRDLLAAEDVEIAGECEDGLEAIQVVREHEPDLLFLDIQMPGLDGFEVLTLLEPPRPLIVFTTAFDQYAVRAFDEHALDYLLKPIDAPRFRESMQRARTAIAGPRDEWTARIGALVAQLERRQTMRRVVVKSADRVFFVETRDIDWFEAAGNYIRVHAGKEAHLVRMTMQSLAQRLDPGQFVRVHRSMVVNVSRIAELRKSVRGDYDIMLRSGASVPLQRAYHDRLRAVMGDF